MDLTLKIVACGRRLAYGRVHTDAKIQTASERKNPDCAGPAGFAVSTLGDRASLQMYLERMLAPVPGVVSPCYTLPDA